MDTSKIIDQLLEVIGGADNIKNFEHCATRLRIVLKDNEVVDKQEAEQIDNLQGYFYSTGQHQFVFGTGKVNDVYQALANRLQQANIEISSDSVKEDAYANMNPVQKVVRILADILVPLIPVLVTTGLLMGLRGLLLELGMVMSDDFAALFAVLTDTAFAFLPVFITYSATKKFGGNPIIGIAVGLMLVAPQLPNAYSVAGGDATPLNVFGINIQGYQGSIFPAIIAGWLISWLDQKLRQFVPKALDLIVTPFLTITLTLVIMLFALGPVISFIEDGVIGFIVMILQAPFGIGYILFGGLQQLLVVTGLHHSLSIIEISLIEDTGRNILNPLMTASMAGQFGAAIATASLMKDKVRRSNMISSASSTLFGITEPLLFGVNLRSLRILLSGVAGGAVAGFLAYLLNLSATGMGITFIPGLLLYTDSLWSMARYLIVVASAFVVAFLLVRSQGTAIRQELEPVVEQVQVDEEPAEIQNSLLADTPIYPPLIGDIIQQADIPDPVFSSGAMGPSLAIKPSQGRVVAPFDGEVVMIADTKHAIGLKANTGAEVLIHIGIDTVELAGQPFEVHVQAGDSVTRGQLLVDVDLVAIEESGRSTITPVIVTNAGDFSSVDFDGDSETLMTAKV